jgi:hemoglobin
MRGTAPFRIEDRPPGLTDELLTEVITEFYRRVRQDRELGPVFDGVIGRRWDAHMAKIMLFWRTATGLGKGYHGRDFMPAHLRHTTIRAALLPQWLALFRSACVDLCPPAEAAYLIDLAERMAENLDISLARRDDAG